MVRTQETIKKYLISITIAIIFLATLSFGYEIEITQPTAVFQKEDNTPLSARPVFFMLKKGDMVELVGCIDDGSNVFFQVKTKNGKTGYMYNLQYKVVRRFIFSIEGINNLFAHPVNKAQCHVMAIEYATK